MVPSSLRRFSQHPRVVKNRRVFPQTWQTRNTRTRTMLYPTESRQMKIRTRRTLRALVWLIAGGLLGFSVGGLTSAFPVARSLTQLLDSTIGGNILLIILIIATVFTGALFDFLSREGIVQSSSTYDLHPVSLNFVL